jgi:hypothetical protein
MGITCALISEAVSEYFKLPLAEMHSARRSKPLVRARHTSFWLARKITGKSFAQIGVHMLAGDHTSVMHGFSSIERLRLAYPEVARELAELEGIIHAAAGAVTALNFEIPKDVDVKLVAHRLISQPLSQFTLSIAELKAMAFALLAPEAEAPQLYTGRFDENGALADVSMMPAAAATEAPPSLTPAASVSPTGGETQDAALRDAAKAVCAAFLTFESERYGRGENAALNRLGAALKHLKMTLKQEVKAS